MQNIDNFAGNAISRFGTKAADATGDALEIVGKQQLKDIAIDATRDISAYLVKHPDISSGLFANDIALSGIALKRIGSTGYIFMYEETQLCKFENAIIRVHPDPRFNNVSFNELSENQFSLSSMYIDEKLMGIYYYWEDIEGNKIYRFSYLLPLDQSSYIVPLGVTAYNSPNGDSRYMLAATIDVSELRALSRGIQDQITSDTLDVKDYIKNQYSVTQNLLIIALLFTLVLSIGLAYLLAKTLTKPISSLTESARLLSKGNFEHRVDVRAGGEFDELASQFNLMAVELKNSYSTLEKKVEERTWSERRKSEHLQSVNEIGQKISSILKVEELFPFVVSSLNAAFHYNVHIFLIDKNSGNIILKYGAREYDRPIPIGLNARETEGLVSYVAQTGKPMLVNNIALEGQPGFRKNTKTKSEIAVPIIAGSQLLGITNIESEEPSAFDEVDLFTAKKVADQLAIAIINARLYREMRNTGIMEERNRLARDIHDNLAQGFVGIILQLEAADQVLNVDVLKAQNHLDRARQLARESLNEARRSVKALRPQTLEKLSLAEGFRNEISNFIRDSGIETCFNITGKQGFLNSEIEDTFFLILRESLFNIRKHSRASHVKIDLVFRDAEVELRIQDDGLGFTFNDLNDQSFGLIGMKERAVLSGGSLKIISDKGKGTLILVKLSINRKKADG